MTVTDLDSTNGTFVDDREVKALKSAKLKVGSEVVFGCARLRASATGCWAARRAHMRAPASACTGGPRACMRASLILYGGHSVCNDCSSIVLMAAAPRHSVCMITAPSCSVRPPWLAERSLCCRRPCCRAWQVPALYSKPTLSLRSRRRDMFLAKFQLQDRPDGPVSIPVSGSAAKAAEAKIGDEAGVADIE